MALSNNMNALLDGTLTVGKKDLAKNGDDEDGAQHNDEKMGKLKGAGGKDANLQSQFNNNQGLNDEDVV